MITSTTRTCKSCRAILPDGAPACEKCSRVTVPHLNDWPPQLTLWLAQQTLLAAYIPHGKTPRARWEAVLRSVIAGKQWGPRVVPRAVDLVECYTIAMQEMEKWIAAGMPDLVPTVDE